MNRDVNDELTVISHERMKRMQILANMILSVSADTQELNEEDEQKLAFTTQFDMAYKILCGKIAETLFTKASAVAKVRNRLFVNSACTPPSSLSGCDFSG